MNVFLHALERVFQMHVHWILKLDLLLHLKDH